MHGVLPLNHRYCQDHLFLVIEVRNLEMREVIKVAYYRAVSHVDHSDNLVIVIRYLKKAPQDFIQGKQEVDTFVGASRIVIEELRLKLVRWGLQLLKVQLIHRS